jgi:leucyl aminopeptidase
MPTAHRTPTIGVTRRMPFETDADLVIGPVFEDDRPAELRILHEATGGEVERAWQRGEFKGKLFDVLVTPLGTTGKRGIFIGAGPRKDLTADRVRRMAIAGALAARSRRTTRIALGGWDRAAEAIAAGMPAGSPDAAEIVAQACVEGIVLANFEGGNYKTDNSLRPMIEAVELCPLDDSTGVRAAVERALVLGEMSNAAREFANEPGNSLTPRVFADRAQAMARQAGLGVEVLDEQRIAALKMGMLLGVARGSHEPPRLVVLRHEPANAVPGVTLGLVGKGITFDTGGISIKPAENMDKMKDDMAGGAAVISAMAAIARLKAPVRCIGVVPMTENMPGGQAVKPGDILTSAEGKTVEIINTDAEGRLVLGDGLWYARQLGATHLVDVATLTGACVVALGKTTSGLFGTPDRWVDEVRQASERAGDRSWPMPVHDDYKEQLRSEIADFTNTGGRAAGAITAALFLKEFTGDLPWVHIDIAGTAWAEETKPYQPKGPTGVAVRTLAQLALAAESWGKATVER